MLTTPKVTGNNSTAGLLRFGHVSEYDAKRHMARVTFPAMNDLVSAWLPVIVSAANGNRVESHIDVGTHVACLMSCEGAETGVILGAFYDDSNNPTEGNADIWRQEFSDGTTLQYDRENHKLNVSCVGDVKCEAEGDIDATSQGNLTAQAQGNISIASSGNTDITGSNVSIKAGNVSITYGGKSKSLGISSPDKINIESGGNLNISCRGQFNVKSPDTIIMRAPKIDIKED